MELETGDFDGGQAHCLDSGIFKDLYHCTHKPYWGYWALGDSALSECFS